MFALLRRQPILVGIAQSIVMMFGILLSVIVLLIVGPMLQFTMHPYAAAALVLIFFSMTSVLSLIALVAYPMHLYLSGSRREALIVLLWTVVGGIVFAFMIGLLGAAFPPSIDPRSLGQMGPR